MWGTPHTIKLGTPTVLRSLYSRVYWNRTPKKNLISVHQVILTKKSNVLLLRSFTNPVGQWVWYGDWGVRVPYWEAQKIERGYIGKVKMTQYTSVQCYHIFCILFSNCILFRWSVGAMYAAGVLSWQSTWTDNKGLLWPTKSFVNLIYWPWASREYSILLVSMSWFLAHRMSVDDFPR